ncbi:MAG: CDP-diacylglycerol--glycerol-3-phosphate 3-phosphatidyltransferase [Deltaproteobacteria bacterium]|nr:CDP-diacylglycerol--glycerol-3-phosphate 3-phosphatidyltransferase [Deltaproteobacteria bacterium]
MSTMNLPNKITMARIVMILFFLIMCNIDHRLPASIQQTWRATGLLFAILAGFTDIVDGYIARKYNMVSDFGKLMDPLADKIFMATTFVMLVDKDILAGWVAVIVLTREFLVTGLRMLAISKGEVIAADISGKIKTSFQMAFLILGGTIWVGWLDPARITILWTCAVWSVVLITVYSGVSYFVRHRYLYL